MKLKDYLKTKETGISLAKRLGVPAISISYWANEKRFAPIKWCSMIEKLTDGLVTRKDLRPDDWRKIWPELASKEDKKLLKENKAKRIIAADGYAK